jgi:hypothetical protein
MAQLFLSHSSLDKPFALRIGIDLLNNDVPVWLDSWEMGPGNSLLEKIYHGIGKSDCLAVLLSPQSVESRWVKRELVAALTKEDEEGRQIVLPIKIASCSVPLEIGDRIYADLSESYHSNLENLVRRLDKLHIRGPAGSPSKELIPLRFANGVYLDENSLGERLNILRDRIPADYELTNDQFVIYNDEACISLRRTLQSQLDQIEDDANYSPQIEHRLRADLSRIKRLETMLADGIRTLVQRAFVRADNSTYISTACHWFALYIRQMIYSSFIEWQPDDKALPPYFKPGKQGDPFESPTFCRLHNIQNFIACDVWPEHNRTYEQNVLIWVDSNTEVGPWFEENPYVPCKMREFWSPQFIYEYFFPQMVFRHVVNVSHKEPLHWNAADLMIGRH